MKLIFETDSKLLNAIETGDYIYIKYELKPYIKMAYRSQLIAYIMQNQRDEQLQKLLIKAL